MNKNNALTFRLDQMVFPNLKCDFHMMPVGVEYQMLFKLAGTIKDDRMVVVHFGVKVESKTKEPSFDMGVESLALFEFSDDIPPVKRFKDIPLSMNLLALMYPFIREKMAYLFSANDVTNFFLKPINTMELIENLEKDGNIPLKDMRLESEDAPA